MASGERFVTNPQLIAANQGQLLHFIHGEDQGWSFAVYEKDKMVCEYSCNWELPDEIEIEESERLIGPLFKLLKSGDDEVDRELLAELREFFPDDESEAQFERDRAYLFAELIELEYYQWLSFDYIASDISRNSNHWPVTYVEQLID